jgi:hypothetical protein
LIAASSCYAQIQIHIGLVNKVLVTVFNGEVQLLMRATSRLLHLSSPFLKVLAGVDMAGNWLLASGLRGLQKYTYKLIAGLRPPKKHTVFITLSGLKKGAFRVHLKLCYPPQKTGVRSCSF